MRLNLIKKNILEDSITYNVIKITKNKRIYKNNVEIQGRIFSKNNVLSNFSKDNYAYIDSIPSDINNFEIQFKFTTGNNVTTNQVIIGQKLNNYQTPQIVIYSNTLRLIASATGSSWDAGIWADYTIQPNSNYIVNYFWDGERISGILTDESGNIAQFYPYGSYTDKINEIQWIDNIEIGLDQTISTPFFGTIDLKDCYININNSLWWNGVIEQGEELVDTYNATF